MTIVRALKLVSLVFLGTPFVQPVLAQPAVSGSSSDPLCVERDP